MMRRLPLLVLLAALLLAIPAARTLGDLRAARHDRAVARAGAAAGAPGPVVAPAAAFPATDASDARRRLAARVRAAAVQGGVLVEAIGDDRDVPPALAALTLRASGPEKAVLAFVDTLERAGEPVRLRSWRLTPAPGGIRIDARMVAPWRG